MRPPVISQAATTDPDLARAVVAAAYADTRLRVHGAADRFRFEHRRVDLGPVCFDHNHNLLTTEYSMDPTGQAVIVRVLEGGIDTDDGERQCRFGPGDICLIARPDRAQVTRLRDPRVQVTTVDLTLLAAVDPEESTKRTERMAGGALGREQARRWQQTVRSVTALVTRDPQTSSDLILGAAGRLLGASLLDIFSPDADPEPRSARRDATPAAVLRAIAFIETNPDLDLSSADIARAAHVSVRALQLAFRRHRNSTPLAYLREVRLDRVRADLIDASPNGDITVSAVAARWGFAGVSRFSTYYRNAYGESPGHTLRQ